MRFYDFVRRAITMYEVRRPVLYVEDTGDKFYGRRILRETNFLGNSVSEMIKRDVECLEELHHWAAAFVEQMFHHLVQQPVRAYGPRKLEDLRASFAKSDYNIRKLAVEIMATAVQTPRAARP